MKRPNFRKAIKRHRAAGRMFGQAFHISGDWGESGLAKNRWMKNFCSRCNCLTEVNLESNLCRECFASQSNEDR
jgi:hypothetical protein